MKKFVFIFVVFILFICAVAYLSNRHIIAVFSYLRPFEGKIPVYYNGILIGKAKDKKHNIDLQKTNVKITLYNKNLKLPLNTKAVLKKQIKNDCEQDYIELIYPEIPSDRFITENSHIHGYATIDIKEYLKNQSPEDLDKIKTNLLAASENLNTSLGSLGDIFVLVQYILEDNRDNLKNSSRNIKEITQNINNASKKIDNSILEEQFSNTFKNIESSTENLHNFTYSIHQTSAEFRNTLPDTLQNANEISSNLNSITCGIRNTLSKKFGGLRLFFGKVIN